MPNELPASCACGTLQGLARDLGPDTGNRLVCYCDDCQAFAHFLGKPGPVLDEHGGTEIFQTSPARLELSQGADQLRCMRLTSKGLLRWYAACCRTPVANTMATPQIPFAGVVHSFLSGGRDEALGPIRVRVQARFAHGDLAGLTTYERILPPRNLLHFAGILLRARLSGDHKRSPFFDPQTREPISIPEVLSPEARAELAKAALAGPVREA